MLPSPAAPTEPQGRRADRMNAARVVGVSRAARISPVGNAQDAAERAVLAVSELVDQIGALADALQTDSPTSPAEPAQAPALLLTPEQAARALAISRTALFQLLRSGQLQSVKIGACRRISCDALGRYLAELAVEGAATMRKPDR